MKKLQPPVIDKIAYSIELDSSTGNTYDLRLHGFERCGIVTITWSGSGGDLSLDLTVSAEVCATPSRFFSIMTSPSTDDDIIQITSLCAEWLRIDATGTTWGSDSVKVDVLLKARNFA